MWRISAKKEKETKPNLDGNSELEGWDLLHESNRTGTRSLKWTWRMKKIGVGQIGRERLHQKLSVNTYFDIFFHDGIIFFSCFLLMTPI